MEYSFPSKGKEIGYWASANAQSDVPDSSEVRNSTEDPFGNMSDLLTMDGYPGWCNSPSATEQLLASYGFSPLPPSVHSNYASYDQMNFPEQNNNTAFPVGGDSPFGYVDKLVFQHFDAQFGLPMAENDTGSKQDNVFLLPQSRISRSLGHSFSERMLRALSLFKESSGGGILAQVWVPIRAGDDYILSTCEQPYLLDQMLLGYREVSRSYTFSVEQKPGSFPGLPGRVFISKIPEWTSNVSYYSSAEYLRVNHAVDHEVRGSVAIPIFSPDEMSCCAVLELVTVKEKPNFDVEMETVCRALEAVDLRATTSPRLLSQRLSLNQRTALAEITDVLRAVCHAHRLPLALTWIPCTLEEEGGDRVIRIQGGAERNSNSSKKSVLCIEETACYVNDKEMQGFVHACAEHPLEEGQGVAGKALQSNLPFFFPDVKNYHINEYPLVQHARKFGLNAAVAIRLRSTYTGVDDYILELFLPLNIKGTKEQQLLLDSLSGTMQRICKSLRTVADAELVKCVDSEVDQCGVSQSSFSRDVPMTSSQPFLPRSELNEVDHRTSLDKLTMKIDSVETSGSTEQASGSRRPTEKKRSTAEKTVSLSVLQQYFSGSLKDAAKSIGVCPTTLKRICRQHGISRWPSRKINKVNRSLRKIQNVLDSVEGVEGGLKFDPTTGGLVAAGSINQDFDARKNIFLPTQTPPSKTPHEATPHKQDEPSFPPLISPVKQEKDSYIGEIRQLGLGISILDSDNYNKQHKNLGNRSKVGPDEMDVTTESDNGMVDHNQPTSSGMTDSSNGSGSGYLSSSPNSTTDKWQRSKEKTSINEDGGVRITIKATYRDDTIRFKFEPSSGYIHLYEEIAKRFKLQLGTFQLKYLDDEEEWVMLVSDSDLQECLEIMEFAGKNSVKFLVRDLGCGMGSSGSSNCFLAGSS